MVQPPAPCLDAQDVDAVRVKEALEARMAIIEVGQRRRPAGEECTVR